MAEVLAFREIAHDDIDELAALVADAFVGYRAFAPAGWRPPSAGEQARGLQEWIADPGFWGELASEGQTLVGHATFIPAARHSFQAAPDPSVAHLGHLLSSHRIGGRVWRRSCSATRRAPRPVAGAGFDAWLAPENMDGEGRQRRSLGELIGEERR